MSDPVQQVSVILLGQTYVVTKDDYRFYLSGDPCLEFKHDINYLTSSALAQQLFDALCLVGGQKAYADRITARAKEILPVPRPMTFDDVLVRMEEDLKTMLAACVEDNSSESSHKFTGAWLYISSLRDEVMSLGVSEWEFKHGD